ncbi:PDZ domain-containing protein [Amycolatopsis dongchuanensis]|uniref:PDZ domain-containing protein n=1 Tax=Amycolatopsis dongchuanensis TaxID=1070866 RepID=A0ABP9QY04_9PSEU
MATLTVAAAISTACTGSDSAGTAGRTSPPAPDLGTFLPANYRVVSSSSAALDGPSHSDDVILVSTGPGVTPDQPVDGGTTDVQVLSFDPVAKRWNVVFDAANKLVTSSLLAGADAAGPQPLLPQDKSMTHVIARPVQFTQGSPDLLIYGLDQSVNHPTGVLAVVAFDSGNPFIAYYEGQVGMSAPSVSGAPSAERVTITAPFSTAIDPACCPVRQFTQVIGVTGDTHTAPPALGVLEDDRPWLGAWYATLKPPSEPGPAIVAGLVSGSPASSALHVGDRLLGVADTNLPAGDTYQPAVVDELAAHHPGDRVTLHVERDGQQVDIPLTLAAHNSPAYRDDSLAPKPGVLGIGSVDAPSGMPPGALVSSVSAGTPAAQAGLAPGDDIIAAGPVTVRSTNDLIVALAGYGNIGIALTVRHPNGTTTPVTVTPQIRSPEDASSVNIAGL